MKQKWGQHFLVHERYVHRMVALAEVTKQDHILEIGPGHGILTRALLNQADTVTAIEIDPHLAHTLQQQFMQESRFQLIHQDVLTCPSTKLISHASSQKLVANLPYHIATAIFFYLFPIRLQWKSWHIMVQKEVAARICAIPTDGKAYSPFSIAGTLGFHCRYAFDVPSEAFSTTTQGRLCSDSITAKNLGFTSPSRIAFFRFL